MRTCGDVTIADEGCKIWVFAQRSGPLSKEESLDRATPAMTRNLGFSGLIRGTTPISRLLREAWGCGGYILTWILTGRVPQRVRGSAMENLTLLKFVNRIPFDLN